MSGPSCNLDVLGDGLRALGWTCERKVIHGDWEQLVALRELVIDAMARTYDAHGPDGAPTWAEQADSVLAALAGRLLPPGAVAVRRGDLEAACDELDDSADLAASEGADEYAERVRVKVDRLRAALEAR